MKAQLTRPGRGMIRVLVLSTVSEGPSPLWRVIMVVIQAPVLTLRVVLSTDFSLGSAPVSECEWVQEGRGERG